MSDRLSDDLPIGRRVAYWRRQRRMSQQVFADRLGRSKSWVDKVERGKRKLDKVSVLQEIADVLQITLQQLMGGLAPAEGRHRIVPRLNTDAVQAALTRYEVQLGHRPATIPTVDDLGRMVTHAWMALDRADYDRLLRALPDLITGGQWCREHGGAEDRRPVELLGQIYQITAEVLTRIGAYDLAWLAADRAMTVSAAADDPLWSARAACPLAATLRESQPMHAFELCIVTAHRLAGANPLDAPPEDLSVYGTLLLHAALAAAAAMDEPSVGELLDQARMAARGARDRHRTSFCSALVAVTEVATAVKLGNGANVVDNLAAIRGPDHQRLPVAVRAAYLVDAARAHLQAGDAAAAGLALVEADRTAAAEVRHRPAVRDLVGAVLRQSRQPAQQVVQLAEAVGAIV